MARLRVRPEGLPVLPRRPPPQDAGDHAAGRRSASRNEDILKQFFAVRHVPPVGQGRAARVRAGAPARRDGARSTSLGKDGKVVVAKRQADHGQAHPRARATAASSSIAVPSDYIVGRALATNVVDTTTGEVLAKANDEITDELLQKLLDAGRRDDRDDLHQRPRPGSRTSRRRCAADDTPDQYAGRRSRSTG